MVCDFNKYANWKIWLEPASVKFVEECILKEDFKVALNLKIERYNLIGRKF